MKLEEKTRLLDLYYTARNLAGMAATDPRKQPEAWAADQAFVQAVHELKAKK